MAQCREAVRVGERTLDELILAPFDSRWRPNHKPATENIDWDITSLNHAT